METAFDVRLRIRFHRSPRAANSWTSGAVSGCEFIGSTFLKSTHLFICDMHAFISVQFSLLLNRTMAVHYAYHLNYLIFECGTHSKFWPVLFLRNFMTQNIFEIGNIMLRTNKTYGKFWKLLALCGKKI